VGLDELLRVLREEAAHEARSIEEEAVREAARVVADARARAESLREAALAREAEAGAARVRAARDAAGRALERALLGEERRQLDALRSEAVSRLPRAVSAADVERFVAELVREAGTVEAVLIVDPGSTAAARRALAGLPLRAEPKILEAAAPRGGVELVTGALVLDDTVAARLERAWPQVEPELAGILFSGG